LVLLRKTLLQAIMQAVKFFAGKPFVPYVNIMRQNKRKKGKHKALTAFEFHLYRFFANARLHFFGSRWLAKPRTGGLYR